jgi:HlyD family secretion protein
MTVKSVAAGLLAFVLAAGLAACARPESSSMAVLDVKKGDFEIVLPAFGELQAAKSTPIIVAPESRFALQTIAWMAPDYATVKGGDVVIRLASTELPDLLRAEEAEVAKIRLEIAQKQKQLEKEKGDLAGQITVTAIQRELADVYAARDETIYPRNKIIEDAIDLDYQKTRERYYAEERKQLEKRVAAELQLLQSKLAAHEVKIKQYRDQLGHLELQAPHDGMLIIARQWDGEKYRVGMTAYSGMKLGSLPDLSVMEAKVFVLESEAAGLKEGLPVTLSLDYEPGRPFSGKVAGIDTIAKPLTEDSPLKYFEVKVGLDAMEPRLMKPGVQVKASIFVEKLAGVIAVPNQAIVYEGDAAFVQARTRGRFQRTPVKTGARSLTRTVITEGLADGAQILLGSPAAKAAKGGGRS